MVLIFINVWQRSTLLKMISKSQFVILSRYQKESPNGWQSAPHVKEVLVTDVLLKALLVVVAAIIILEVDGIKNVYLNFNFFLKVHE
tara:strand:- start:221 stop:481 length:261 start_codon:yes stop_codon:yes gene_type:complete